MSFPILICLLGPFRLLKAGRVLAVRGDSQTAALLCHLGLQADQPVPREVLLQLLWPDKDLAYASQSLRSLLRHVHKLLGDAIGGARPVLATTEGYMLNVAAGVGVDVALFADLIRAGDQHRAAGDLARAMLVYTQALALYRGDLMCSSDTSLRTVVDREHVRARYLSVLAQVATYQFDHGEYQACVELTCRLLRADPCREDAHRLLMRCYMRQGQRAAALHHYQVCREILHREFDTAPEPATVALYNQVRHDPESI